MERIPITTTEQLDNLDSKEIMQGYWDGYDNEPEPGNNRSLSYWHGWRNGQVDGKHKQADKAMRLLAHDVISKKRVIK